MSVKNYRASTELFIDDIWRQGKLYWHGIIANVRTLHLSSTSSQTPTLPRARLDGGSHTSLTIPKAALQVTFLFEHVSYPHFQRQMRPLGIKKGVYEASRISIYICKSPEIMWTYRTQSVYNRIFLHAWISSLLCDVSPSHSNFVLVATLAWL